VPALQLPQSLDAFQQESGRAGRDQQPSESIIYYSRRDAHAIRFLIEKEARDRMAKKGHNEATGIEAQAERELEHLQKVVEYCELADGCR
jgi:superfamily II DNA helicase RecQ